MLSCGCAKNQVGRRLELRGGQVAGGGAIVLVEAGPHVDGKPDGFGQDGSGLDGLRLLARNNAPQASRERRRGKAQGALAAERGQAPAGDRDGGIDRDLRMRQVEGRHGRR